MKSTNLMKEVCPDCGGELIERIDTDDFLWANHTVPLNIRYSSCVLCGAVLTFFEQVIANMGQQRLAKMRINQMIRSGINQEVKQ